MAQFTTKKRRDLTSFRSLIDNKAVEDTMNSQFDSAYANEVKKDKTNNEIFRIVNSELTGLAFEHRYLSGRYRPTLDEVEITYQDIGTEGQSFVEKSYWDNMKLQSAANLDAGNEFHLNIREGTTVSYPIRPDKYSSWVENSHEDVTDFETTETKLIQAVRDLESGISGTVTTTVSGKYEEKTLGVTDEFQNYMPVGYAAYQGNQSSGYMTDGYDKTGETILISNGIDYNNFSFGKIVSSKSLPSRILFVPYGKVGTIPDDAEIISNISAGQSILYSIAEQVITKLEWYYRMVRHYLEYNPNKSQNNLDTLENINSVISLIEIWESVSNKLTWEVIITLMDDIDAIRLPVKAARVIYIESYLVTPEAEALYIDRFNSIDLRLSKVGGTLKELMTIDRGTKIVQEVLKEQSNALEWYSKFFIIMKVRKDGEYFRRLFVDLFEPGANTLEVGQKCYILSDNEDVPEISAVITHITDGRLVDMLNTTYDEDGNANIAYTPCKKIFFDGVIFNKKYLTADNLRIIREI